MRRQPASSPAFALVQTLGLVLALLGTLMVQLGNGMACADRAMACATGDGAPAKAEAPAAPAAHESCSDAKGCCCGVEQSDDELAAAVAVEHDAVSEASDACCRSALNDAAPANCSRCGCLAQRAPPTPAPERPARTVEFKPIPAILNKVPERPLFAIAMPRHATPAPKLPIDRGKHRALLSVWVI